MYSDYLFAACDPKYYDDHSKAFVVSSFENGNNSWVHVVSPGIAHSNVGDGYRQMDRDHSGRAMFSQQVVNHSFKNDEDFRAFMACSRFYIAQEFIHNNHHARIMILDIDCIIRDKIEFPDAPIGLFLRDNENHAGMKVAAGILYIGYGGSRFLDRVVEIIDSEAERVGQYYWFIDQVAIYQAYREWQGDVHIFNRDTMDWEMDDSAPIWTGKGSRKYTNEKYLEEKRRYEQKDYSI